MKTEDNRINEFLNNYSPLIAETVRKYSNLINNTLPNISSELDLSARIISFGYGNRYKDNICSFILSKNGVKLGFNRGAEFPNENNLLIGTGKTHRYVDLFKLDDNKKLVELLNFAYQMYLKRI